MTKTSGWTAISAILALAACSQDPQTPDPAATATAEPSVVPPVASQAQPGTVESEAAPPAPTPPPTPAATLTQIPETMRGRWGLVPADCTSKLGDAKGLLTIGAGQLKFYESVARIGPIKEADETHIRATFNFSGEGQTWTQDVVLRVENGGKALARRDYGPDAMPGELRYARCG